MKGTRLSYAVKRAVCCSCSVPRSHVLRSHRQRLAFISPNFSSSASPSSRPFSTSSRASAVPTETDEPFQAAPEIDFGDTRLLKRSNSSSSSELDLSTLRIVPASPSYFTSKPAFTDRLLELEAVMRKYETLPAVAPGQAPRVAWKTLPQVRAELAEPRVRALQFARVKKLLHRLQRIHPDLMPAEVADVLHFYRRAVNPHDNVPKPRYVDEHGRAMGVGKRKTSRASAWLIEGDGQVLINGRTLVQAFGRLHDRESAVWPLKITERLGRYNMWALVRGGGTTGQAEALTLAVAKALMVHEPTLKPVLRRAGCVTRDPRKVERKKPGRLKARKKPAWVKR